MIEERKIKLLGWMRALSIVVGIASLLVGFCVLIFPGLGILFLVTLLSVGLIFMGFERLIVGISGEIFTPVLSKEFVPRPKENAAAATAAP